MLTDEERGRLRATAEGAIRAALGRGEEEAPDRGPGSLSRPGSAFVTVRRGGRLRGCIGTIGDRTSLAEAVRTAALRAIRDPRFPAVTADELPDLRIEISVLTPFTDPGSPEAVVVGRHGLHVSRGFAAGLLLPQVAVEQGWDRETFLDQACRKAGLPPGAWREAGVELKVFEAEVF